MKKTMILLGFLALAPFAKGQLLLEALEGGIPFTPSEKCLERVKDKHYGDGVHNYIYCAVQGPNGKKWLNLNLGAEYAKESSPHFNPEALPTDYNDWKAFGNLYQWGRDSDGHEQVEYREGSENWEFRPINGVRSTRLEEGERSNQMVQDPKTNVYMKNLGNVWVNDPCPTGYHIATLGEIQGIGVLDLIEGAMSTASLFGSKLFPNLILMTTPGTSDHRLTKAGWNLSSTGVRPLEPAESGTSQLWLGDVNENHVYQSTGIWGPVRHSGINLGDRFRVLDRGYYAFYRMPVSPADPGRTIVVWDKYEYGATTLGEDAWEAPSHIVISVPTTGVPAKSIRCVQN